MGGDGRSIVGHHSGMRIVTGWALGMSVSVLAERAVQPHEYHLDVPANRARTIRVLPGGDDTGSSHHLWRPTQATLRFHSIDAGGGIRSTP